MQDIQELCVMFRYFDKFWWSLKYLEKFWILDLKNSNFANLKNYKKLVKKVAEYVENMCEDTTLQINDIVDIE